MDAEKKTEIFARIINGFREEHPSFEVSRWFALGEDDQASLRQITTSINRKLYDPSRSDRRHATTADAAVASMLEFLNSEGYDLSTLQYDENGALKLKKRRKKK